GGSPAGLDVPGVVQPVRLGVAFPKGHAAVRTEPPGLRAEPAARLVVGGGPPPGAAIVVLILLHGPDVEAAARAETRRALVVVPARPPGHSPTGPPTEAPVLPRRPAVV